MLASTLQDSVLRELRYDPRVDAAKIGVSATDAGVVTLTGAVNTYAEKLAAQAAANRVFGVKAVANDLEVKSFGAAAHKDSDIAEAAINSLKWRTTVPEDRIKVAVSNGWVTLSGNVDYYFQKKDAQRTVSGLAGVKGVTNNVTVTPPAPKASPSEVKSEIEAALVRSARLDARRISVRIQDSKAILEGTARNWDEAEEAETAAWNAPGVRDVDNRLAVVP